jgi:hypothetical protein
MTDISILCTADLNFLNDLPNRTLKYWGDDMEISKVKKKLTYSLMLNPTNKIFLIYRNSELSCFFMYREMLLLPTWILCNFFIVNHKIFSPNVLGFGYGLDKAVELGESRNKNSFFWAVEKSTFKSRFKSGIRDIKSRNSILKNYSFNIYADSDIHKEYDSIKSITGNSEIPCYVILASRQIGL